RSHLGHSHHLPYHFHRFHFLQPNTAHTDSLYLPRESGKRMDVPKHPAERSSVYEALASVPLCEAVEIKPQDLLRLSDNGPHLDGNYQVRPRTLPSELC